MRTFAIRCEGITPLLMHNGRLIDPLDPIVKQIREVNDKTKKSEADHREISHLEWLGGMYYQKEIGPFIPAPNLQKSLVEGARFTRNGKDVERGVFIQTVAIPLIYEGPRDVETMWESKKFIHRAPVKIGPNRVMRTRPVFNTWGIEALGMYDDTIIPLEKLQRAARTAGTLVGICDYRPYYGKYQCELEDVTT